MPTFTYQARDQRGKAVTGTMGAPTPEVLADQLKAMGFLITRAREVRPSAASTLLPTLGRGVSSDELVLFTVQLAKLIHVGIPLVSALRTLEEQTTHRRLRATIGEVTRGIESGASLSEAMGRHTVVFSPLFVSMIHAGEVSGQLDEILTRLATLGQHQARLREQLQTAMTYPVLLLVVGLLVMGFLVMGIIPKFMKIFVESGVTLPWPTLMLHQISVLLRHAWWAMLLGVLLALAGLQRALRTPAGRRAFDTWVLRVPVAGLLARQVAITRFARTFETLAKSGVPILESLAILERTAGNVVFADVITQVKGSVSRGAGIADPLQVSGEIPPMVVQMIRVGEGSGTLDHMLGEIADHYDEMVRHGIQRTMAFVEPLFLGIMGGMVAFIMASVLLPMFKLVNVVR
jgi:type IV pilus assembly protein PilC